MSLPYPPSLVLQEPNAEGGNLLLPTTASLQIDVGCFGTKEVHGYGVVNPAARSTGKYLGVSQGNL